jgi:hypothetical protein
VGNAILKFISPNDVGLTGGHQCGFYLPKSVWQMFTPHKPEKGKNHETEVKVTWPDGRITDSRVKWYGAAKSEYRLTRFGKDFPYLTYDNVGELLVLIPETHYKFTAFVLDHDTDIEDIEAALGVEITKTWAVYRHGEPQMETEDECVEKKFRKFVVALDCFPTGAIFSRQARDALIECIKKFDALPPDELLMQCMDAEYRLFRLAERQLCQAQIVRVFKDVDDFLRTASSIMNRRKSRAGRSLENHMEYILRKSGIPHVIRPKLDGEPDIVIPSVEAYNDRNYPANKLVVVGVKTTCKDRWRQVVHEAKRVTEKHILTIQQGISSRQLTQMYDSHVTLIVPARLHKQYPKGSPMTVLDVQGFLQDVRQRLA